MFTPLFAYVLLRAPLRSRFVFSNACPRFFFVVNECFTGAAGSPRQNDAVYTCACDPGKKHVVAPFHRLCDGVTRAHSSTAWHARRCVRRPLYTDARATLDGGVAFRLPRTWLTLRARGPGAERQASSLARARAQRTCDGRIRSSAPLVATCEARQLRAFG